MEFPKRFTGYEPWRLKEMADLVWRASSQAEIDPKALHQELLGILYSTGTAHDGSERAVLFQEAVRLAWSRENLAPAFRRVARASNPLHPSVLRPNLRSRLERQVQLRWGLLWRLRGRGVPTLDKLVWDDLGTSEKRELREMAEHLAAVCQSDYPAHRPRDDRIETLLILIAELFAKYSGYQTHPDELPHAAESCFMQMASRALAPFFDEIESDAENLSKRWKRRKECPPFAIRPAKRRQRRPGPKSVKSLN